MTDKAEEAYWRFDARRKGYGEWKEAPQSERDAFKAEYTDHAALLRAVAEEARKLRHAEGCHSFVYPNTNATTPHAPRFVVGRLDESKCNCPRGKVLAMLEVE